TGSETSGDDSDTTDHPTCSSCGRTRTEGSGGLVFALPRRGRAGIQMGMVTQPTTSSGKISVNRAPVLTLWGAVVAERLGFSRDEALSLGSAVAVLNAQAKGKRLGIFKPGQQGAQRPPVPPGEEYFLEIVGRPVPVGD